VGAEKLERFLSRHGVASRRKTSAIVTSGRVRVNGRVELDPLLIIDSQTDAVSVDNRVVAPALHHYYFALNKPVGYISDLADPRGRPLARSLIRVDAAVFPVGRLDFNSEGLLLFTNDGEFANRIMHPRYGVEKEYHAKLAGKLNADEESRLRAGVRIDGLIYRVKEIGVLRYTNKNTWYRITITEGRNRFIRRIAEAVRHPVIRLRRIRIDGIRLGGLKPGEYTAIAPALVKSTLAEACGGVPGAGGTRADTRGHFH
jgi:23S rRNA pseudouridine2605 synthase